MAEDQTTAEKNRIAFHDRAARAVELKIRRIFPCVSEEDDLQSSIENEIFRSLKNDWKKSPWKNACSKAIIESNMPLDQNNKKVIDDVAGEIAMRYVRGFYLHRRMLGSSSDKTPPRFGKFYDAIIPRDNLMNIHNNHLSNQAEAQLRDIGISDKSAHKLHGRIIASTLNAYREHLNNTGECTVDPQQGSVSNKTDEEIADDIKQLKDLWKVNRSVIENKYRNFRFPDNSGRSR